MWTGNTKRRVHGNSGHINNTVRKGVNQVLLWWLIDSFCQFHLVWFNSLVSTNYLTFTHNWDWTPAPTVGKQLRPADQAHLSCCICLRSTTLGHCLHCDSLVVTGSRATNLKVLCILSQTVQQQQQRQNMLSLGVLCDILMRPFDMTCLKGPCYSNPFHNILLLRQMIFYPTAQTIQRPVIGCALPRAALRLAFS